MVAFIIVNNKNMKEQTIQIVINNKYRIIKESLVQTFELRNKLLRYTFKIHKYKSEIRTNNK